MTWLTQLRAKLYPKNRLDELSAFDRIRFITLLNIGGFGLFILAIAITINIVYGKYDRAFDNLTNISAYLLPTLWLTYRYKLQLA